MRESYCPSSFWLAKVLRRRKDFEGYLNESMKKKRRKLDEYLCFRDVTDCGNIRSGVGVILSERVRRDSFCLFQCGTHSTVAMLGWHDCKRVLLSLAEMKEYLRNGSKGRQTLKLHTVLWVVPEAAGLIIRLDPSQSREPSTICRKHTVSVSSGSEE